MTSITVKYVLTPDEYASSIRQRLLRASWLRFFLIICAFWIASPLLSILLCKALEAPMVQIDLKALIFPGIGLLMLPYLLWVVPWRAYRNLNPAVRGQEQEFRFTDDGMDIRWATGESKSDWKGMVKFQETRQFFLLFPQAQIFYPIPKRAFASPQEMDAFREMLKRKLGLT